MATSEDKEKTDSQLNFNCFFGPLTLGVLSALVGWAIVAVWQAGYMLSILLFIFCSLLVPFSSAILACYVSANSQSRKDKVAARYGLAGSLMAFCWGMAIVLMPSLRG